jgi:NADH-quinone oxidoreductase subunit N
MLIAGIPAPDLDYHALAPEIVVTGTILMILLVDLVFGDRAKVQASRIAALGVLGAIIPVLTLGADGDDVSMFSGSFVVDNFALIVKAFFLVVTYLVILVSVDAMSESDVAEPEYYVMTLTALLGMMVMGSSRDLISIFVALETISIPTYLLAGWKKHDHKSNEAMLKYFIFGVLASAVMLYGMSLVYGTTGSTLLSEIAKGPQTGLGQDLGTVMNVGIFLTLVGFAFKISAVPFHFWTPDTYEGAPTPVTAFLSVASKAGGMVAIFSLIYAGFYGRTDAWQPIIWVMAALSMTVGNMIATKQTNIVRMLAYSSIAQAGFMLVPFAVAPENGASSYQSAFSASVIYMLIYGAMNIGAFATLMAIARRTRSGEITSFSGLFSYAPTLAMMMSVFLMSLAGVPIFAGWFAKFVMFQATIDGGTGMAYALGIIAAVNSVIAFFYYGNVVRLMFFREPVVDDRSPIRVPTALGTAIALCAITTVAVGIYPELFARLGERAPF